MKGEEGRGGRKGFRRRAHDYPLVAASTRCNKALPLSVGLDIPFAPGHNRRTDDRPPPPPPRALLSPLAGGRCSRTAWVYRRRQDER